MGNRGRQSEWFWQSSPSNHHRHVLIMIGRIWVTSFTKQHLNSPISTVAYYRTIWRLSANHWIRCSLETWIDQKSFKHQIGRRRVGPTCIHLNAPYCVDCKCYSECADVKSFASVQTEWSVHTPVSNVDEKRSTYAPKYSVYPYRRKSIINPNSTMSNVWESTSKDHGTYPVKQWPSTCFSFRDKNNIRLYSTSCESDILPKIYTVLKQLPNLYISVGYEKET